MMKERIYLRLLLAVFAFMVSLPMSAYDIAVKNDDGVTIYYLKNDETMSLSVTYSGETYYDHSNNYTGNVNIPSSVEYGGKYYSVTSIGQYAFYRSNLTSLTIPNSVTSIGMEAFERTGLTSISFPNSVTYIGGEAFYECYDLTSVTIPSSVTYIGKDTFYCCYGLEAVHITDLEAWCKIGLGGPILGGCLYLNGEKIKNLVIPNSVTSISAYTFNGCESITSITSVHKNLLTLSEVTF